MSSRRRRRPRRNIWSEPPPETRPFDYEETGRPAESKQPPPAPDTGVFDVVRYNTPQPEVERPEPPAPEMEQPADRFTTPEPQIERDSESPGRGRHLSHRRVVLPKGRKRGRHSAPAEPEVVERDARPDLEMEPRFDPDADVTEGEATAEPEPQTGA
ncbi:MAG: hypothetical protein ACRDKT_15885, partial [Actinomycetota bacterium]